MGVTTSLSDGAAVKGSSGPPFCGSISDVLLLDGLLPPTELEHVASFAWICLRNEEADDAESRFSCVGEEVCRGGSGGGVPDALTGEAAGGDVSVG